MFDEPEEIPRPDEDPEVATQDLANLADRVGLKADPEPSQEEIAKLAHHLWELRRDNPASAPDLTAEDDWRRAEAILSGDAGMGQLEEHDPAASD